MYNSWTVVVGRAVASNSQDPWFKSDHRQILFTFNCIINQNKEKEAGMTQKN